VARVPRASAQNAIGELDSRLCQSGWRGITRVAVLRDSAIPSGAGQFGVIQAMAVSLSVEINPVNVHNAAEIERAVMALARPSNGGLIISRGRAP
jgi:hypothetical protein